MKWIGQHIWDFMSRFRSDVYMEDLAEVEHEFSVMVGPDGKLTKSTHPGERSRIQVRNDEGATIPAGAPLYSKGEIGGSERILVGICVSSDTAKMPCIGIAEAEMNTTDTKDNFAITQGVYNTNISGFTGLSVGDNLYVNGGSAPHLTQTKPTNGDLIQNVGIVLKTNGTICQGFLVSAIGRTNDVPWPLYVDHANQRVGIETTSPAGKLTVIDTAASSTAQKFHVGRATNAGLTITDDDATAYIKSIQDENASGYGNLTLMADDQNNKDGYISFNGISGGERARITSDGKLLLNLTSYTGNEDFIINSTTNNGGLLLQRSGVNAIVLNRGGTPSVNIFNTSGSQRIRFGENLSYIKDGLMLGSSSAPSEQLHVSGNAIITGDLTVSGTTTTINTANLNVEDKNITLNYSTGDSSSTADGAGITIQDAVDSTTDATILWDATNDKFDFSHGATFTNNVGIGTSSPLATIHASGNIMTNAGGSWATSNGGVQLTYNSPVGYLTTYYDSNSLVLGAGVTQKTGITINGHTSSAGNNIKFRVGNSERMRLTSDGRLGIGTTNPPYKLTVQGNAYVYGGNLHLPSSTYGIVNAGNISQKISFPSLGNFAFENVNVGIGTTSPSHKFEVRGGDTHFENTSSTNTFLDVKGTSANAYIRAYSDSNSVWLYQGGSSSYLSAQSGSTLRLNSGSSNLIFLDSSGEVMRSNNGNVLIGTTTDNGRKLQVNGDIQIGDNNILRLGDSSDLSMYHTGTGSVIQNATGNLTIQQDHNDYDIIFRCDDGSGGTTAYITLDGSVVETKFNKDLRVVDNEKIIAGTSNDLEIFSSGADVLFRTWSGDMIFQQNYDDGDIIFQSDDGSGGVTPYITLDGSDAITKFNKNVLFGDNTYIYIGAGFDFHFSHNGTDSFIQNTTGDIYIKNAADDKGIIFQSDNGLGGLATYFRLDGSVTSTIFEQNARFLDTIELRLGTSNDLKIHHNGSNSYIENEFGDLYIQQKADDKDIIFLSDDGAGSVAEYFRLDGSSTQTIFSKNQQHADNVTTYYGNAGDLSIYHDGSNSYIKHVSGATGDLIIEQGVDDGNIIFRSDDNSGGLTEYFRLNGADKRVKVQDGVRFVVGTDSDLQIYHNGANSFIENTNGDFTISNKADDKDIIFQSDDGAGGVETYFYLDGSAGGSDPATVFPDNSYVHFGSGFDLNIGHNGSTSYITNNTGDLYIRNLADDKDIIFQSDNGSGGVTEYFRLNGGFSSPYTNFPDNSTLSFGGSNDLRIYHDGTSNNINSVNGNLNIAQYTDDSDIVFYNDNGSGGLAEYFRLDGSLATHDGVATTALSTLWPDNSKIVVGAGADGRFWHNGTNTFIQNVTGNLEIINYADDSDIIFKSDDGSGGVTAYLTFDGSAAVTTVHKNLIFDDNINAVFGPGYDLNIRHLGSHSEIQNDTGNLEITQRANDCDIIFECDDGSGGVTEYFRVDGGYSSPFTVFPDNSTLAIGSGLDLRITHNGSDTFIDQTGNGDLYIRQKNDDKDIIFQSDDGSGDVETYFYLDGSEGLNRFSKNVLHQDNVKGIYGTGLDLQIYHDGTHSYIVDNGTGNLWIGSNGGFIALGDQGASEFFLKATDNGSVELYYDNVKKFETASAGVKTAYGKSGTTDGDAAGDIVYFGGTTLMEVGEIYYLTSSGTWALADADAEATAKGMLAVALGGSSDTDGMLVRGFVTLDHDPGTVGDTLFLSTTAGLASSTAPSGSGDIVRVIGYCLDNTNGQIYFNPDGTFVEVA